ncbi:MAG: hypothetical protein JSS91_13135 [Bacteroidetes bacterium]|nr:hypothetical protein [Bacteroidota bacterium]
MKTVIFIALIFVTVSAHFNLLCSQNCSATHTGKPPLLDLGTNYFRGFQGGLYPNGSNLRPPSHNSAGIEIAKQIVPLDTNGNYDPVNGKIVFASVGMSNCNLEFAKFMLLLSGSQFINPYIVLVNAAQGGYDINLMLDTGNIYWDLVKQKLSWKGVTDKQVQVIWFKNVELGPTDTTFPGYPQSLKSKQSAVMNILNNKFPNLKSCYIANRIYAGYAVSNGNREPFAYYSGWSAKWMIEDQINGSSNLIYRGANKNSPWLSWGPYLWADGTNQNIEGLKWNCPVDYLSDGTHPSDTGSVKVAQKLLNFFTTDETARPWFYKSISLDLSLAFEGMLDVMSNTMSIKDTVIVNLKNNYPPYNTVDSDKGTIDSVSLTGNFKFYNAPNGNYYIQVIHRNGIETWSRSGGEVLNQGSFKNYDFTFSAVRAFGNNLLLKGNKYCIFSGDTDHDGVIDISDLASVENDAAVFLSGYVNSDLTGDGLVDVSDSQTAENNASNFIAKITP